MGSLNFRSSDSPTQCFVSSQMRERRPQPEATMLASERKEPGEIPGFPGPEASVLGLRKLLCTQEREPMCTSSCKSCKTHHSPLGRSRQSETELLYTQLWATVPSIPSPVRTVPAEALPQCRCVWKIRGQPAASGVLGAGLSVVTCL